LKVKEFFINMLKGGAVGIAVIIPGVSGGTIAVLLNIYDKIIESISGLKSNFKKSISFLLPIVLGIVAAIAIMYFPLSYALKYAPLPTVLLFLGLMTGSTGFKKTDIACLLIPFALVIGICFIPGLGDVNLSESMVWYDYVLLVPVGIVASCALVVPGISGSMLMVILGYYSPLLGLVSALKTSPLHSILVFLLFAVGVIIGFFTIAKLMQYLLSKFTRATYWAIVGFVLGSLPAILIVFDYETSPINTLQIVIGIVLCLLGALATYLLTKFAKSMESTQTSNVEESQDEKEQ
jgi:putative membrane protein